MEAKRARPDALDMGPAPSGPAAAATASLLLVLLGLPAASALLAVALSRPSLWCPRPSLECARASSRIADEYAVPLAGEGKAGAALDTAAVDKQTRNKRNIAAMCTLEQRATRAAQRSVRLLCALELDLPSDPGG